MWTYGCEGHQSYLRTTNRKDVTCRKGVNKALQHTNGGATACQSDSLSKRVGAHAQLVHGMHCWHRTGVCVVAG